MRQLKTVDQGAEEWRADLTVELDVSDAFTHFCELDADGEVVASGRLRTTTPALQ